MSRTPEKQILVAGIGNSWLHDDGFGSEVASRLSSRALPSGVSVFDFGSGGLQLAYEVIRGYDALVLVDVSRQGGEPGTLYLMDAHYDDVPGPVQDGDMLDPHGMDPQSVLRFVKMVGGWPGRVVVIACEPADVEEVGMGLSPAVEAAVNGAVDLVLRTCEELRHDSAYEQPRPGTA